MEELAGCLCNSPTAWGFHIYLYLSGVAGVGLALSPIVPTPDDDMMVMVVVAMPRNKCQVTSHRLHASVWYKLVTGNVSVHGKRHIYPLRESNRPHVKDFVYNMHTHTYIYI